MTTICKVYVTDAYMIGKNGCLEWATDVEENVPEFTSKHVETHNTVKEAMDSMSEWGSRWAMYSGVIIEDVKHGEVYSSIPAVHRCPTCKHEEWENVVSDLRTMRKKDGTFLFPEVV